MGIILRLGVLWLVATCTISVRSNLGSDNVDLHANYLCVWKGGMYKIQPWLDLPL